MLSRLGRFPLSPEVKKRDAGPGWVWFATEQKRAVAELFMTELGSFAHWPVA
jgi:hypothetical protein